MTLEQVINRITELNRPSGSFFGFETETKPKLNKKSRSTGVPCDFEVTIKARFSAMLGVNYENAVNNRLEKDGKERTFEAQKPFGKSYISGSKCIMTDDKTHSKYYVAVDKVGGMVRTFYINGREATKDEIKDITENYMQKPSENKYGITWRTYGVESIIEIR